ncbi:MAG: translocation/assembly module TamB domain-containing protein [Bryobacterales bacterium]
MLGWVRARNLPAEKALAAGRLPALLSGLTDADAAISGSAVDPDLRASATIHNGSLAGRRFDLLELEVDTTGELARVSKVALTRDKGRLTGSGTYNRNSGALDVKVRGVDWGVDQLVEAMEADWPATGIANLDVHVQAVVRPGQRPVEQLRADGTWSVASFDWGGHAFGDLGGSISTDSDTVTLDWNGTPLGGTLGGKASLRLDQDDLSGSAEFTGFDAAQVLRLAGASAESLTGELSGGFTFHADPSNLADVEIEGSIEKAELDISELPGAGQGYALYNPFPMRWAIRKQTLEVEHMRLQGKGADFEVDGDAALTGDGAIDLKAEGMLDLAVLQSFRQDLQAEGATVLDVTIGGTLDAPSVDGKLRIENGSIRSSEIPNGLNALNGEVAFAGRDVRIEELSALSGGGKLVFSGTASFAEEAPEYRFNVDVDRVRLRYPANISSLIDGQIVLSGASNHGLLAGEVIVRRASTNSQVSLGALLATLREPTQTPARAPWLDQLQLNVHVASGPDFELETTLVRNIEADLDLRLVGTAVSPSVLGRMNINQGQVNFNGSRYTINRGEISFVNPFRIEPVLDFELQTRIRAIDIGLILSGPARRLNMSYRSDPPLSISDLVNLVAVGRSPTTDPVLASQQRVQQQSLFQTGANNVFEQAIERPVSPGLQRFFGVSRLKVDPQAGGAEANPSARISTEQQITNEVTLIYTYDLSSAQQQTFRLEYAPDRRWTLVLTRDQNGLVGSDVLYKTRLP